MRQPGVPQLAACDGMILVDASNPTSHTTTKPSSAQDKPSSSPSPPSLSDFWFPIACALRLADAFYVARSLFCKAHPSVGRAAKRRAALASRHSGQVADRVRSLIAWSAGQGKAAQVGCRLLTTVEGDFL